MSLQDCLDLFTNEEILDGDEKPVSSPDPDFICELYDYPVYTFVGNPTFTDNQ